MGLGEPIFDKIDALIAHAIMSIPAVKGVEIGLGFQSAESRGEENSDEIVSKKKVSFKSNNSGWYTWWNYYWTRYCSEVCCKTYKFNIN